MLWSDPCASATSFRSACRLVVDPFAAATSLTSEAATVLSSLRFEVRGLRQELGRGHVHDAELPEPPATCRCDSLPNRYLFASVVMVWVRCRMPFLAAGLIGHVPMAQSPMPRWPRLSGSLASAIRATRCAGWVGPGPRRWQALSGNAAMMARVAGLCPGRIREGTGLEGRADQATVSVRWLTRTRWLGERR